MAADDSRTFQWTVGVIDKVTKPLKKISNTWESLASTVVKSTSKTKGKLRELGDGFRDLGKSIKETGEQIKAFATLASAAVATLGVGALAIGLIGGIRALVMHGAELEEQLVKLVTVTGSVAGRFGKLSGLAQSLSVHLGRDVSETQELVNSIADARSVMRDGVMDISEFTRRMVDYELATGESAESSAELFTTVERLTGEAQSIRRLGDAMKYWADRTKITNSEMSSLVQSAIEIVETLPKSSRDPALRGLTAIGSVFADYGDPNELVGFFNTINDLYDETGKAGRAFIEQFSGLGPGAIADMLEEGDFVGIMDAALRAAENLPFDRGDLRRQFDIEERFGIQRKLLGQLMDASAGLGRNFRMLVKEAKKEGEVSDAAARRLSTMARRWDRMKQKFKRLLDDLSGPIMRLVNDAMGPLYEIMEGLVGATRNFFNTLKDSGIWADESTSFFEKLSATWETAWKSINAQPIFESMIEKLKKALEETDFGDWFGEKILAPAFRTAFSDSPVLRKLLGIKLEPKLTAEQKERNEAMSKDLGGFIEERREARRQAIEKEITNVYAQATDTEQKNITEDAIIKAFKNQAFVNAMATAVSNGTAEGFRKESPTKAQLKEAGFQARDFRAVDNAIEWDLMYKMYEYLDTNYPESIPTQASLGR